MNCLLPVRGGPSARSALYHTCQGAAWRDVGPCLCSFLGLRSEAESAAASESTLHESLRTRPKWAPIASMIESDVVKSREDLVSVHYGKVETKYQYQLPIEEEQRQINAEKQLIEEDTTWRASIRYGHGVRTSVKFLARI